MSKDYTLVEAAANLGTGLSTMGIWFRGRKNARSVEIAFLGKGKLILADDEIRRLKQELERTRRERDILKSNRYFDNSSRVKHQFIVENMREYSVSELYLTLSVSTNGYYVWL